MKAKRKTKGENPHPSQKALPSFVRVNRMGHPEKQSGVEPCLRQAGAALQKGRRAKAAELRRWREALRYMAARADLGRGRSPSCVRVNRMGHPEKQSGVEPCLRQAGLTHVRQKRATLPASGQAGFGMTSLWQEVRRSRFCVRAGRMEHPAN
jgi:hypothetical protein